MAGLADFLGGIASGIGDFGKGVVDLVGSGIAATKDLGGALTTGKWDTKEQDAFKKWLYGTDNIKDALLKSSGTMLNGASTVADFVPGLNALTSGPIGNAVQGALGGVADELKTNGANFDWNNAGLRAASGAAAGAATGLLGDGINKSLSKAAETGSKGLLAKAGSNALTRGALTGAVGGAAAGGVSTFLNGGDLGQVLANAAGSGASGGLQGLTSGAAMNMASKALTKAREAGWQNLQNRNFENAIQNPDKVKEPVYLGKLQDGAVEKLNAAFDEVDADRATKGLNPIDRTGAYIKNDALYLTKDGAQHLHDARLIKDGMTPKDVRKTMRNATSDEAVVVPNHRYPRNATMGSMNDNGAADVAHITGRNGKANLESTYPTDSGDVYDAIKKYPVGAESTSTIKDGLPARRSALRGTDSSISQNANDVNIDTGYPTSKLAEQSGEKGITNRMRQVGNYLESRQANVTGDQLKHAGIKNSGKVIETVRKRTGLTNLQDQAEFSNEVVDAITAVRKMAMSATEDGSPINVDVEPVTKNLSKWAKEQNLSVALGSKDAAEKTIATVLDSINADGGDIISKANTLKDIAADCRGKGSTVANNNPKNVALAKYYQKVGDELDELAYSAIPEGNTEAAYGGIVGLFRKNAEIARANGNDKYVKAYRQVANEIDSMPKDSRSIKNLRSYLAPFVQAEKINSITQMRDTTSGKNTAISLLNPQQLVISMIGNPIAEQALAKAGGMLNSVADHIDNPDSRAGNAIKAVANGAKMGIDNPTSDYNNALYNITGRSIGRNEVYGVNNPQTVDAPTNGGLNDNPSAGMLEGLSAGSGNGAGAATTTNNLNASNPYANQVDILGTAMQYALNAGDAVAYSQLMSMHNDAYQNYAAIEKENNAKTELSSAQQKTLLGIQNAYSSLQQLEQMYNEAGGGQGGIRGNLANFLGSIGANDEVSTYNQQAQSLINTIKDAVGKTDTANTEGEVERLMELIPKITDTQGVAEKKLSNLYNELERIYRNTLNNYAGNYALS